MDNKSVGQNMRYGELVESKKYGTFINDGNLVGCVVCGCFATWSVVTQVDEIAKAKGAVIPEGEKQVLQSDIGGKLKRILVKEGQLVEKGQPLVEFDATFQQTALEELKSQQVTLLTSIERMNALLDNREPDFVEYEVEFPEIVSQQKRS